MGRELEELEEVPAGNVLGKACFLSHFLIMETVCQNSESVKQKSLKMSRIITKIQNSCSRASCLLPPV